MNAPLQKIYVPITRSVDTSKTRPTYGEEHRKGSTHMAEEPHYRIRPPVLSTAVEDEMDIVIVRDTARRTASLLGFSPAHRAQLASAAATLAEMVLQSGGTHTVQFNGVLTSIQSGMQIMVETPHLEGVSANNILVALRTKLGDLVDEIFVQHDPQRITIIMWLNEDRGL